MQLLIFSVLLPLISCQSEEETAFHFSNPSYGRVVWIVDGSKLPWIGQYEYLRPRSAPQVSLLTVVDSSSGITLGECTDVVEDLLPPNRTWSLIQWVLKADSLLCTVSSKNSSRVVFPPSTGPRTFSVRLQSLNGPSCGRDIRVQNERSIGCPPHFSENSFSSNHLKCGCPSETEDSRQSQVTDHPHFPIFELGSTDSSLETRLWTISPCADFTCQNNGTCVVTQEGSAACLCRNGFIGAYCEVDVCSTVPCQHGGSCRANGGEAFCDCPPPYTGLLCESAVAICDPPCANGECVVRGDKVTCECEQGFTGSVCNVVDVCLGDAVCSIFGEQAKCVIDETSYTSISPTLYNATYECRCPHPLDGEYVDCLALHLSTSVFESIPTVLPSLRPAVTRIPQTTTSFPTEKLATQESKPTTESTHATIYLRRPVEKTTSAVVSLSPSPFLSHVEMQLPRHLSIILSSLLKCPRLHLCVRQAQQLKIVHFSCTTTDYPTTAWTIGQNVNFSHKSISSAVVPTVSTTPGFNTLPTHVTTEEFFNIKDISTEAETVPPPVITTSAYGFTTSFTSMIPTNTTLLFNQMVEMNTKPSTLPSTTAPQTTVPFWTTSTEHSSVEDMEMTTMRTRSFATSTPITFTGKEEYDVLTANVTKTAVADVGGQKSSAVSWVVAIVAVIVLGLLLLATTLFVLRYVKQSRKLHGKYNPAREEHALSTAFSMPMSHMSKDERLI
ncbi:hypothetical protein Y032_0060g3100 [Ancylostoma ceylanicum]|uniref:EGF-like domain-containing protein n=1 Tax=Ancylostoma ceylanicum TaxID=53326 RepID=A0A016U272_9BILA|nr:hypothetical protein Y032_0060g3100 [Ancylostoma ceylanicum]